MTWQRILFMGSPEYAVPTLTTIYNHNPKSLIGVITQPDKIRSRGKKTSPTPVKQAALELDIPCWTPETKDELAECVDSLNPDLIVVIAYGRILPKTITDSYMCINLHGSILPAYRGASPVQASLLNGDTKTGITLIQMNEKMDEGPILDIQDIPIETTDNAKTLHDKLSDLSAKVLKEFLCQTQPITPVPQPDEGVSYCHKITKEDLLLDLNATPEQLLRQIKAYGPIPGAYTITESQKRVKITEATLENETLLPIRVKPEGKAEMPYSDYLLAHPPLI